MLDSVPILHLSLYNFTQTIVYQHSVLLFVVLSYD